MKSVFLFKGKVRDLKAALLTAMLTACGQAGPGEQPSAQIPAQVMDSGKPSVASGSRIKVGFFTGSDGTRIPSGSFFDTQLNSPVTISHITETAYAFVPFSLQFKGAMLSTGNNQCLAENPNATLQVGEHRLLESGFQIFRFVKVGEHGNCDTGYTFTDETDSLVQATETFE